MATIQNKPKNTDRARLGGSAFTVFTWNTNLIAFARQVSIQAPTPVGSGTVPIHPMDHSHPVELLTPAAATMGSMTLELYELYNEKVWQRLDTFSSGDTGSNNQGSSATSNKFVDIVSIFKAVYAAKDPITITKWIKPPKNFGSPYPETYHNIVVSQVIDGETIEIGSMEILKQLVVNYTHVTRDNSSNDAHSSRTQLGASPDDISGNADLG